MCQPSKRSNKKKRGDGKKACSDQKRSERGEIIREESHRKEKMSQHH